MNERGTEKEIRGGGRGGIDVQAQSSFLDTDQTKERHGFEHR